MKLRIVIATVQILILGFVVSCYTPLSQTVVDELTKCTGVEIKQIKANLLLAGYEIKTESEDVLTTGYKQVYGYTGSTHKSFQSIYVVKIDKDTVKFRVNVRDHSLAWAPSNYVSAHSTTTVSGVGTNSFPTYDTSTTMVGSSTYKDINEAGMEYYQELIEDYKKTQADVCGKASNPDLTQENSN